MKKYIVMFIIGALIGAFALFLVEKIATHKAEVINKTDTIFLQKGDSVDIPIRVTVYQPTEEQCDESPTITACGDKITEESYYHWCAVSRDLIFYNVNFGDTIVVKNDSTSEVHKFVVKDSMGSKANWSIDILVPPISAEMNKYVKDHYYLFNKKCRIIKILRK